MTTEGEWKPPVQMPLYGVQPIQDTERPVADLHADVAFPPGCVRILNHGYVRLLQVAGSDENIVEAARMSTDGAFRGWGDGTKPGDEKLLTYLYSNGHMTPFEMGTLVFEVQAPIFVARQVFRHRTFSYNELSARYTELPELFWLPEPGRVRAQGGKNKQAGNGIASPEDAEWFIEATAGVYRHARAVYEDALKRGIAREQARAGMPVGGYTRWRMAGNLRNWFGFFTFRLDKHAQGETREMAEAMASYMPLSPFPRAWQLFQQGRLNYAKYLDWLGGGPEVLPTRPAPCKSGGRSTARAAPRASPRGAKAKGTARMSRQPIDAPRDGRVRIAPDDASMYRHYGFELEEIRGGRWDGFLLVEEWVRTLMKFRAAALLRDTAGVDLDAAIARAASDPEWGTAVEAVLRLTDKGSFPEQLEALKPLLPAYVARPIGRRAP